MLPMRNTFIMLCHIHRGMRKNTVMAWLQSENSAINKKRGCVKMQMLF